jgi:SAM-dependent methyltransferase
MMADLVIAISFFLFTILLIVTFLVHGFFRIPYVPSKVVDYMIKLAKIKAGEKIYDLGCGDGRLLIRAEKKYSANGVGFEIAPLIYAIAWFKKKMTRTNFELRFQSLFKADIKDADVIFCYLLPSALEELTGKLKNECKKGARIVSHTFAIPGLTPAKVIGKKSTTKLPNLYLYTV